MLTPHDGEFGLLAGHRPAPTASPPPAGWPPTCARVVLLKGPATVVAEPGGDVLVVANGDARLATAGTGDVLSGIIGALLATGHRPVRRRRRRRRGSTPRPRRLGPPIGLVAGDLLDALPAVLGATAR